MSGRPTRRSDRLSNSASGSNPPTNNPPGPASDPIFPSNPTPGPATPRRPTGTEASQYRRNHNVTARTGLTNIVPATYLTPAIVDDQYNTIESSIMLAATAYIQDLQAGTVAPPVPTAAPGPAPVATPLPTVPQGPVTRPLNTLPGPTQPPVTRPGSTRTPPTRGPPITTPSPRPTPPGPSRRNADPIADLEQRTRRLVQTAQDEINARGRTPALRRQIELANDMLVDLVDMMQQASLSDEDRAAWAERQRENGRGFWRQED